jgi:hypothetical protein
MLAEAPVLGIFQQSINCWGCTRACLLRGYARLRGSAVLAESDVACSATEQCTHTKTQPFAHGGAETICPCNSPQKALLLQSTQHMHFSSSRTFSIDKPNQPCAPSAIQSTPCCGAAPRPLQRTLCPSRLVQPHSFPPGLHPKLALHPWPATSDRSCCSQLWPSRLVQPYPVPSAHNPQFLALYKPLPVPSPAHSGPLALYSRTTRPSINEHLVCVELEQDTVCLWEPR